MKPVEVEFLMRDKLTPGLDKAGKSAESLGDKAESVAKSITERIAAMKEQIKQSESDLKSLKKQFEKMAPGKAQLEMKAEIEACTKAIGEDKAILAQLEAQHKQSTASTKRLSMELRELLDSMARMRLEGKQNTAEYQQMAEKAAQLSDTIGDLRTQTNILAHDDAGLQGVMSGINGLSGAFTVATGIMGTFVSENEELARMQTRVQSVMAITMGLQQVFNTLNKDSAFRLVTVRKAKDMLTSANARLATALGVSNIAAGALMATLTFGLSLVITGAVVLWNKYSDAQERAAEKSRELIEIESDARAQMIKARFEIENTTKSLKGFSGSKEQERIKVEELNRKYGESFGYYNTVAEWYDVLVEKGNGYIQMLFMQAKAQSLINKAVEADKTVEEVKATPESKVDGSMGWLARAGLYMAQSDSYGQIDAQALIDKHNKAAKDAAVKAAESRRDAFLDEARKLQEEYAKLGKDLGIGGFSASSLSGSGKPENNLAEMELEAVRRMADLRLDIMRDGYAKERAEAKLNFEREKERISSEEAQRIELYNKLKASGGSVSPGQLAVIKAQASAQRALVAQKYDAVMNDITDRENKDAADKAKKRQEELEALLAKYQDYEARRAAIVKEGDADIASLTAARTEANAGEIDRAIAVVREKVKEGLQGVKDEEARATMGDNDFMRRLFGDYSGMSLAGLEELIGQARRLREYLNGEGTAEGLTFISEEQLKNIEASPAELEKLRKALDRLLGGGKGGDDKWTRILGTFRKGLAELRGANGTREMAGAVGTIAGAAEEATGELAKMLETAGAGEVAEVVGRVSEIAGAVANIGEGFAKGGLVGGIGAAVGEAASLLGDIFSAEARHREALKEIERSRLDFQREYNLELLRQNLLLEEGETIFGDRQVERAVNAIAVYRDALAQLKAEMAGDVPEMNLAELLTGDAWGTYRQRLEAYNAGIGGLSGAQIVTGHKKTGLFGWGKGKDTYSSILSVYPELVKANGELDAEMLRVILNTRKMSDETRGYLENLIELKGAMEEAEAGLESYLKETFGGLGQGMLDSITSALKGSGTALENFAANAAGTLEELGEQVAYSLFFADEFAALQQRLKEVYGSGKGEEAIANDALGVIDSFYDNIGKNADAAQAWMEAWKEKAKAMGYGLWQSEEEKAGTQQSGRAGAYTAMSQDQGTKLEGLFTSVQMHAASIDERLDGFMDAFGVLCDTIGKILANTDRLPEMADDIRELKTNGIKLRSL